MSINEICRKQSYFSLRTAIKNKLETMYAELNLKVRECFYVSCSIYRYSELYKKYILNFSISLYKRKGGSFSLSENDFSGYVFDKISEGFGKKSHEYLKLFYDDIVISNKIYPFYSAFRQVRESYFFQVYLVFESELSKVEREYVESIVKRYLEEPEINCIYLIDRINFKNSIKSIRNKIILLVDLSRDEDRFREPYKSLDVLLTSKMVFEIKDMAGSCNFKVLNHTGDGFLFIYDGCNISNDIKYFSKQLGSFLRNYKNFQEHLTKLSKVYKIRGILDFCRNIYEFDYGNLANTKVYFSPDLDRVFYRLSSIEARNVFNRYGYHNFCILLNRKIYKSPSDDSSKTFPIDGENFLVVGE